MKAPLVSVIVPIYDVEKYLRDCIDSILAQSYTRLEVILVDDGSPDGCPTICDQYAEKDPRVQVIHQKNAGLSAARNSGLDRCTGEYITFVDSDDFIHQKYIEKLMEPCLTDQCVVSIGVFERVPMEQDATKKVTVPLSGEKPEFESGRGSNLRLYTDKGWSRTIVAWNKIFHKNVWGSARFPDVAIHEDEALIYQVLYHVPKVAYVNEVLYFYRVNPSGIMKNRFSPKKLTMVSILEERLIFYKENNDKALIVFTWNREYFTTVEYYQILKQQPSLNKELICSLRKRQWELYKELIKTNYPLKRKVFYTMALLAPGRFTRLYCMKE